MLVYRRLWRSLCASLAALLVVAPSLTLRGDEGSRQGKTDESPTIDSPVEVTPSSEAGNPEESSSDAALEAGLKAAHQKLWATAIERFSEAIQLNPQDAGAYYFRAQAQRAYGETSAAKEDFKAVVRIAESGNDVVSLHARAVANFHLAQYDQALADLSQGLAIDPAHFPSLLLRGQAQEQLKASQDAWASYSEAIKQAPRMGEAYLRRGNLAMRTGRTKEGLLDQRQAIRYGGFHEGELVYRTAEAGVEFRFIFIAPGHYWLGYDDAQRVAQTHGSLQLLFGHNATPSRHVILREGFFILDQEITNAQFAAIDSPRRRATPQEQALSEAEVAEAQAESNVDNFPKTDLAWNEAMEFCQRLQQKLQIATRLPTEIEWECSARLRPEWIYPWGVAPGDPFRAWASKEATGPRALARSQNQDVTPHGVFDMAGNVSEWCLDEYQNSPYQSAPAPIFYVPQPFTGAKSKKSALRAGESMNRPQPSIALSTDSLRCYRGGSYRDNPFNCQAPVRRARQSDQSSPQIGFRPVVLVRLIK
ncbi:SUMF1/EgtB/PvdO family nonheme iron enzyme [Blastopirellula marina]|uniref:Sulfatase-modifying factor enzyme-like domain-containing protein n=1 Tax=Blastopirellula marina DSM 3645 TaxID=314230 RepID=A3ZPC8_9BACT|nr:SUMF1/EgtB/PvdO family nonheme iron enzyme [Blastopirellula marina]EAQ81606.1 hypothetical protein DSM3645_28532 [Blastopirellula marina DSM 3645]